MLPLELNGLVEQLCAEELLAQACPVPTAVLNEPWAAGLAAAIEGVARVDDRELRLRVGFPRGFPSRLPRIYVLDVDLPRRLPHVGRHGWVCFQEQEGLLLDCHRPAEVVREAVARAIDTLRGGLSGDNHADFIEELALHWPGAPEGFVFFTAGDEIQDVFRVLLPPAMVFGFVHNRAQARALARPPMLTAPMIEGAVDQLITASWMRGLYIPLSTVPRPLDPFPVGPWTPTQVARFVRENLSAVESQRLDHLIRSMKKPATFVIVRVPRPRGGDHLVGVEYTNIRGAHPLARAPGLANLRQFQILRQDPGYLVPRGGGAEALQGKRVLLIGCGAIGGHLALELVRCGVGHITLVDPDVLRPENQHRHVLGAPPLGLRPSKSALLAAEIQQRYPGVQAMGLCAAIGDALACGAVKPEEYDLILSATGEHNVERALHDHLSRVAGRPSMLFTWLEPLGIGGHAFAQPPTRGAAGPRGCFECLFTPHPADPTPALANRAAFAALGQVFTRELAGCGNAFTPYSSLDALRTAGLAARLAIDTMLGQVNTVQLRSWKGTAEAFSAAGLRTSPRYDLAADVLERGLHDIAVPGCPVCGAS
jgi:hypothetical protein